MQTHVAQFPISSNFATWGRGCHSDVSHSKQVATWKNIKQRFAENFPWEKGLFLFPFPHPTLSPQPMLFAES